MPGRPSALPFVIVGVFTILLVGAIVLSLSTAPPLDEQQLHAAATATLNASGFVLVDTISVTSSGSAAPAPGSQTVVVPRAVPGPRRHRGVRGGTRQPERGGHRDRRPAFPGERFAVDRTSPQPGCGHRGREDRPVAVAGGRRRRRGHPAR